MTEPVEVMLARCEHYRKLVLKQYLDAFGRKLSLPESFAGKTVLLKPNLISWRGSALACTNGHLLAAVAEWFQDRAACVVLGDSPAFGSAGLVLRSQGIARLIKYLDLKVVEFKTPRLHYLSHDVAIGVAEEALACDFFVNLPKVKAHSQMFMTMAVKNLFGIVVGMRKGVAHMKNGSSHIRFADLMLDLVNVLPRNMTIADGIEVMHRQGPVGGESLNLSCLAASWDPIALDTAMLGALELDHHRSPIWTAAKQRGLAGSRHESLEYPMCDPSEFHGSGFIAPDDLSPVPFNPLRFIISSIRRALHGSRT